VALICLALQKLLRNFDFLAPSPNEIIERPNDCNFLSVLSIVLMLRQLNVALKDILGGRNKGKTFSEISD
jgi:hypothetical protein